MVGEYFGAIHDFEYNIGDKLYEFAIMDYKEFDRLKAIYTQLIELICFAKESDSSDEKMDCDASDPLPAGRALRLRQAAGNGGAAFGSGAAGRRARCCGGAGR